MKLIDIDCKKDVAEANADFVTCDTTKPICTMMDEFCFQSKFDTACRMP